MTDMCVYWRPAVLTVAVLFAGVPLPVAAQNWKPERPVELIVACAPGCGPDNAVRVMQRVFPLIDTDDWKSHMVTSNGITQFVRAAPMKKQMDEEYPEVRALLIELELAKK